MSPWLEIVIFAVMMVGFVGLVLPVLPGLLLMWAATLVWVLLDGGGAIRWATFAIVSVLAIAGTAAATWMSGRNASEVGAPWWVLAVGVVGMIVGFFTIPILGLLVGGVGAIWVAELVRLRSPRLAWDTTWAAIQGYGVGTTIQLAAGVAVLLVWLVAVWLT
ncbi:MAG TPA: DUF456 domain-containing protein [Actinomycetes bacterium]|nr:DUF456 domain-containing protein [Actinomycetes bacterium]